MAWLIRFVITIFKSLGKPSIKSFQGRHTSYFRVMPWDLDIFFVMNNNRFGVFAEMSRWEIGVRTGIAMLALKKRWNLPVGEFRIRFFKPLFLFQKFSVTSELGFWDEKWLYWRHEFSYKDRIVAEAFTKTTAQENKKIVKPEVFFQVGSLEYPAHPPKPSWV